MEYRWPFDTSGLGGCASDCKHGWMSACYDLWSTGASNVSGSSITSSSPATASFSSSCFSVESSNAAHTSTRRSSNVSPVVPTWSDGLVTPPVTPQGDGKWCTSTPLKIPANLSSSPYIRSHNPLEVRTAEEDSLWIPKSWQQEQLALSFQKAPSHCLLNNAIHDNRPLLPFTPYTNDPALSRQIFTDPLWSPGYHPSQNRHLDWPDMSTWPAPQTIAPEATVQSLIPSSPLAKAETSSPFKAEIFEQSDIGAHDSPLPVLSPRIVPSQNCLEPLDSLLETITVAPQPTFARRTCDRSIRRQPSRKTLTSMIGKPRRISGTIVCDAVIPQNTFACSFPGCIDKSTQQPKRFKRQEHRKRHEITVHKGEKKFFCWVPGCSTGFTRTDNLKNHIQKTHGKNNPAQRNRYVATLDESSRYYDPSWQGGLTDDGYPLVPEVAIHRCWAPSCDKLYHLEDKLKTHLLQQHGKKSSSPDVSYVATVDENSDFYDPKWERKMAKEGLSVQ